MTQQLATILSIAGFLFCSPLRADLPATIAKVKPSVVLVGTFKTEDNPRFNLLGSGFVVSQAGRTSSNLVVTNAHLLSLAAEADKDASVVVRIQKNPDAVEIRPAVVLDIDRQHDLALLRVDGPAVTGLGVGDSDAVQEGQAVAFTGFPIGGALGFSPVTHRGMVSSITTAALPMASARGLHSKTIHKLREGNFAIFQLDGTAYPGNSGGPLFDMETGVVLGVVNMVLIKSTREAALSHPSGISYAIPSKFILPLLQKNQAQ